MEQHSVLYRRIRNGAILYAIAGKAGCQRAKYLILAFNNYFIQRFYDLHRMCDRYWDAYSVVKAACIAVMSWPL
jgi:hypothetical protein